MIEIHEKCRGRGVVERRVVLLEKVDEELAGVGGAVDGQLWKAA